MSASSSFFYIQYMICPKDGGVKGIKSAVVRRSSKDLAIVAIRLAFGRAGADVVVLMCEVATEKQLAGHCIVKLV